MHGQNVLQTFLLNYTHAVMLYEEKEVLLNPNFHKYAGLIITHISASLTDVAMRAYFTPKRHSGLIFPSLSRGKRPHTKALQNYNIK